MNWISQSAVAGFIIGQLLVAIAILKRIERNTRPPKPDIKSFINRNTKGNQ